MIRINRPIIVEGKYDKLRLSLVVKARIITTGGFRIFSDTEKAAWLRRLADKNGIIILTDSDNAGMMIRNHIKNIIPADKIINIYVPEIKGREKRKSKDSSQGLLGVEGIDTETLERALTPFSDDSVPERELSVSKSDFYELGLSGGKKSAEKRRKLALLLGLPSSLSSNALLSAVNELISADEFNDALSKL